MRFHIPLERVTDELLQDVHSLRELDGGLSHHRWKHLADAVHEHIVSLVREIRDDDFTERVRASLAQIPASPEERYWARVDAEEAERRLL